jgi:YbbR domain-containing protein
MKNKVLSISLIVLFSIVLWVSVALSGNYVVTLKVPVKFVDLPDNYSVEYSSTDEVFLQIKAKGWDLAKLHLVSNPAFEIPIHRKIGHHKNNITDFVESNAWLNSPTEIIDTAPNQIDYDIEKSGTKEVFIGDNYAFSFREGFGLVSKIKIEPATIIISGSSELLKQIDSVKTVFREITDIDNNTEFKTRLEKIDGVTFSKTDCKISFEVQKIVDKSFNDLAVETQNVPSAKELVLFPGKVNIVLKGGINKLGKLTNDSIKVYVDYWTAMKEASGKIQPVIEIPDFTTIIDVEPKTLDYIIKQK